MGSRPILPRRSSCCLPGECKLEKDGYDGLFNRRRHAPSPTRVPAATIEEVLRLYRTTYADCNVQHFHELLAEHHHMTLSYNWVKRALQMAGNAFRTTCRQDKPNSLSRSSKGGSGSLGGGNMTLFARIGLAALVSVFLNAGLAPALRSATPSPVDAALQWNLDIDRAMDAIGLTTGMVVGEAGAGDGYFTFPMARRVGATGVVLANDISKRALESLDRRRVSEGLVNIQTVMGEVDDPMFPRRDLQVVVVVHAFHDFSRPVEWLVNLKKYLRPGASLAIIDRDPAQGAESHFWSKERIVGYASEAGYVPTRPVDDVSAHLILLFKAPEK